MISLPGLWMGDEVGPSVGILVPSSIDIHRERSRYPLTMNSTRYTWLSIRRCISTTYAFSVRKYRCETTNDNRDSSQSVF